MLNFNIKSISLILLLGWISNSTSLEAQEQSPISLEEVKAQARSNNTDLKLFQKKYEVARANYEQTRAVLLPQVRLTNTSTFTNNPLMAFGFKLLQRQVRAPHFDPSV